MIEEENESILTMSCQKSHMMISSKLNTDADPLLAGLGIFSKEKQSMQDKPKPEQESEDPFEYSKKSMQNFHRKSAMEQPQFLKEDLSVNKSFNLQNLGQSLSYRGSISDIKNLTDNLTLNSGDLQKSSTNLNFFSSNKKELSQIFNNVFATNKCKSILTPVDLSPYSGHSRKLPTDPPSAKINLTRDILTHRKMSEEQPVLRVDSGVSPSKSRTMDLTSNPHLSVHSNPPVDEQDSRADLLKSEFDKSHHENVFYFESFIQSFESLLVKIRSKKLGPVFDQLKQVQKERKSEELVCQSEEQLLKNIDNFLFKTGTLADPRASEIPPVEEDQKIESIQQLEGFEDVESLLRSALSKQISNQKSRISNSKTHFSSQMNMLTESFRQSQRNSKGLRLSIGSSFRGSGKSIKLQVASPINAGQLMNELIFSKKHTKKGETEQRNSREQVKQSLKRAENKEDIKGEFVWNEASTKQSL